MSAAEAALRQIKAPAQSAVRAAAAAQGAAFVLSAAQACLLGFALAGLIQRKADWTLLCLWLAAAAARIALDALAAELAARAGARVKHAARRHVAERFLSGAAHGPGLVSPLNDDIESLGALAARHAPLSMALPAGMLAALAFAFSQSWVAGAILLLTGPLTPLFMALIGYRAQDEAKQKLDALADMSRYFLGRLRRIETIRAFGAEAGEAARMARFADAHRAASVGVLRIAFLSSATIDFFATLSIALVATYVGLSLLGILPFSTGETISAAEGFAVLLIAPEYFAPLRRFALAYHDRADARAAAERLRVFYDAPAPGQGADCVPSAAEGVVLDGLRVGYARQTGAAPIDASLPRTGLIAVVGESGAGKSALLRTLAGLNAPLAGAVRVADDLAPALLVSQTSFLFPGSVAENLSFGRADISGAAMAQALCDVGLAPTQEGARAMLARRLGDVVTGVSGGEAKRIAIARALLRGAALLLLDEPTAHLDHQSEQDIVELLARLSASRLVIAATHAPALRRRALQVIEVRAA